MDIVNIDMKPSHTYKPKVTAFLNIEKFKQHLENYSDDELDEMREFCVLFVDTEDVNDVPDYGEIIANRRSRYLLYRSFYIGNLRGDRHSIINSVSDVMFNAKLNPFVDDEERVELEITIIT